MFHFEDTEKATFFKKNIKMNDVCFLSDIDKHPELSDIAPDEELDLKILDPVTAENLIACVEKRIKASV